MNGSGQVTLSAGNNYTGGTTINAGTLQLGAASGLGSTSGSLTVNGGLLDIHGQNATVGPVVLAGGGIVNYGGAAVLTAASYAVESGFISANLAGPGGLAKDATPALVSLSGNNSYSGGMVVNGGTLVLLGNNSYSGATTIANGTLRLVSVSLANPSFESPALSSGNNIYYSSMTASQQANFAWVASGNIAAGGPCVENNYSPWGFTAAPDGAQACVIQRNASISQVVNFPASGVYPLAWLAEDRPGNSNPIEVLVRRHGRGHVQLHLGLGLGQLRHDAERHGRDPYHRVPRHGHGLRPIHGDRQRLPGRQRFAPRSHRSDGRRAIRRRRAIRNLRHRRPQPDRRGPERRRHLRRWNDLWKDCQQRQRRRRPHRRGHEPIRRRACRRSDQQTGPVCQRRQPDAHWPEHLHRPNDDLQRHAPDRRRHERRVFWPARASR